MQALTDLNINLLPELTRNHVLICYLLFIAYASQPKGEWGAKAENYVQNSKRAMC